MPPKSPGPTVFIDRNSGGRTFRELIEAAGISVVLHDEQFPGKTQDHEWLQKVGDSGWLLVSGDDQTTRSPLFLAQLSASRAHVYIMHGLNGATRETKALRIAEAYPKMCKLAKDNKPPALWRIGRDGIARRFDFRRTLEVMLRRGRG